MVDARAQLAELEVVFAALAHAARRHVLLVVWFRGGSMSAGDIAGRFSHTWPTTSRHLRVLEAAGLLAHERQGRARVYRVRDEKLGAVRAWLRWFEAPPPALAAANTEEEREMPSVHNIQRAASTLRDIAMAYPEATEHFPWGERAIKVKGKVFLFMFADAEQLSLSTKLPASHEVALLLPYARPTGYGLGKSGWVTAKFEPHDAPPIEMLRAWIDESYRAVAPKQLAGLVGAAPASPGRGDGKKAAKEGAGKTGAGKAAKVGVARKAGARTKVGVGKKVGKAGAEAVAGKKVARKVRARAAAKAG